MFEKQTLIRVMEKKFTQGRWYINGQSGILSNIQEEGDVVCFSPKKYDASMENWEANAKLIAAAPDLLEACIRLVDCYENGKVSNAISDIESAIKKALE